MKVLQGCCTVVLTLLWALYAHCQTSHYTAFHKAHEIMDRLDIVTGGYPNFHTSLKYFQRGEVYEHISSTPLSDLSLVDQNDRAFIVDDNSFCSKTGTKEGQDSLMRRPFWSAFFKTPGHFLEVNTKDFQLVLNPILNLRIGEEMDRDGILYQNTRGIELYGTLDEKLYFYTNFLETQAAFNSFIDKRIQTFKSIPGQAFYKNYKGAISSTFDGYDFAAAQAYLGLQATRHFSLELGHGRHFLGNGYRSLLLSDYATHYFYLKFNIKVWKLHYQTIYGELAPLSAQYNPGDRLLPKKYAAMHYLGFKPRDNIELGIFEAVVFSRENQFELQYLNPVILYRTVEFLLDSPDNVIIGLNGKINVARKWRLYAQAVVDEFKFGEITAGDGWWGNKYGVQIGLKMFDVGGIDNLDAFVEYNMVRPFTFSHTASLDSFDEISVANYGHYLQPLAHPLGSNFSEWILAVNYRPASRIYFGARFFYAQKGENSGNINFGGNIFTPNTTRVDDYGHALHQGISNTITTWKLEGSFEIFHNMFIDAQIILRNQDSDDVSANLRTNSFMTGFRFNIGNYKIDY